MTKDIYLRIRAGSKRHKKVLALAKFMENTPADAIYFLIDDAYLDHKENILSQNRQNADKRRHFDTEKMAGD